MSAVIEKALATARTFEEIDEYRLHSAIKGLKDKHESLLGVEQHAKAGLEKQLGNLAREALRLEHWKTTKLPMIDEVVLTWRNGNIKGIPLPSLIMTSLDSPESRFDVTGSYISDNWRIGEQTILPIFGGDLPYAYGDVMEGMMKLSKSKRGQITLKTIYHGVIPDKAKAEMEASPFEKHELFLLREVQRESWSLGIKIEPAPPKVRHWDPLVVGVRDATLWLVTSFDPTPLEEYVRDEFALLAGSNLQLTSGS